MSIETKKSVLRYFYVLILLSATIGCEDDTVSNSFSVSGVVVYQGRPLQSVSVSIDDKINYTTETNEVGAFSITNIPAGDHEIKIRKVFVVSASTGRGLEFSDSFSEVVYQIYVTDNVTLNSLKLPKAVNLLEIENVTFDVTKLIWSKSDAEDFREYKIYRHHSSGLDELTGTLVHVATSIRDTTFLDENVEPLTQYYYRVFTMNEFGRLGGSNIKSVTTPNFDSSGEKNLLRKLFVNSKLNGTFEWDIQDRLINYCFGYSSDTTEYTCYTYEYEGQNSVRFSTIVKKVWSAREIVSEQPIQFHYASPLDTIPEFYIEDGMKFQLTMNAINGNRYHGFSQSRLSDGVELGKLSITYDSDTITGWIFTFQNFSFQERVEVSDFVASDLENPLSMLMYHYPFVLADIEIRDSEYDVTAKDINSFLPNTPKSLKLSHSRNCVIGTRELNYRSTPYEKNNSLPSTVFRTSLSTNCELPLEREIGYLYTSK